ncbi:MAG: hypothetical protein JW936_08520 [Sedimentisphaerales bacterium]|nr:hypothetical protein [Sedimentisphaerales bacterium]
MLDDSVGPLTVDKLKCLTGIGLALVFDGAVMRLMALGGRLGPGPRRRCPVYAEAGGYD